jgi:hypothetical protein
MIAVSSLGVILKKVFFGRIQKVIFITTAHVGTYGDQNDMHTSPPYSGVG